MSNIVKMESSAVTAMTEAEVLEVLENSLYPGARPQSIKLVLGYCKASGLDPMQKPVHIVPISVKQGDSYVMRDTVMPGIGLYRTQAARTGQYAGVTEPEFGPDKELIVGNVTVKYPEWCKITVKRIVDGKERDFTAKELWLENYATAKRDTIMPNAMWKRRSYGQLAKCTEAQALRKAFPEVGSAPTADEMDGKSLDEEFHGTTIDGKTGAVETPAQPAGPQPYPDEAFKKNMPTWAGLITSGKKTPEQIVALVSTKGILSEDQHKQIYSIPRPAPEVDPFVAEMEAAE